MRVSKPPEERKREMIDTAMKLFAHEVICKERI